MRAEFVVETHEEYLKFKKYTENTLSKLKFESFDVYCEETKTTYFYTPRGLGNETYVYKEEIS